MKATTTTENTGRGMSLSVIYCDEFAFVNPPTKAKEFWTALSPTLATGGKCLITSTPNSDEDQFALIWKEALKTEDEFGNPNKDGLGRNGFAAYKCHWSEHPDRDESWAKDERSRIGEERFRREHECEFLIYDETLINSVKLVDLEARNPSLRMGQTRWYEEIQKNKVYLVALDPCLGTGGDYAAIQIFQLPEMKQVAEWQHNTTPVNGQVKVMREILKHIHDRLGELGDFAPTIYYTLENNTLGEAALMAVQDIGEENIQGTLLSEPQRKGHVRKFRKGFNTTFKHKISACAKFKQLIEEDKMTISSKNLLSELKNFVATGTSYSAKPGEHDDLVSACLLIVRMMQVIAGWDAKIYDRLRDEVEDRVDPMPIFISMN